MQTWIGGSDLISRLVDDLFLLWATATSWLNEYFRSEKCIKNIFPPVFFSRTRSSILPQRCFRSLCRNRWSFLFARQVSLSTYNIIYTSFTWRTIHYSLTVLKHCWIILKNQMALQSVHIQHHLSRNPQIGTTQIFKYIRISVYLQTRQ